MKMKAKRIYILLAIIAILFLLLLFRLSQIQLFSTESFGQSNVNLLERSVAQRSHQIVLSNGRGTIVDRNGIELTNKKVNDAIIFPGFQSNTDLVNRIAEVLAVSTNQIRSKTKEIENPLYLTDILDVEISEAQFEDLKEISVQGFLPVERSISEDPSVASHFVGLVRENKQAYEKRYEAKGDQIKPVGISGIEQAFDPFLLAKEEEKLLYHVDAVGQPMFGFELLYSGFENSFYPLTVETTIDVSLQKKAEELLAKYKIKDGGIVLLDVESRDVLVMASRPLINSDNPYEQDSIANRMLISNPPGSVFKTVVALAAIEQLHVDPNRTFNCSKDYLNDNEKANRDLGMLNFEQSFAKSCNRTFAELAVELMEKDPDLLNQYVDRLGLLGPVGWTGNRYQYENLRHFPQEQKGSIWGFEGAEKDAGVVKVTAIGQRDVRLTPLAVANMMATIASNGENKSVRGVKRIVYKNGSTMTEFEEQKKEQTLNPYSLNQLKKLMIQVTSENGTASSLQGLDIAGKSGTAQMGDSKKTHHWFGGFFPYEKPKYAMVGVEFNNTEESSKIYSVYKELVEFIYETNK